MVDRRKGDAGRDSAVQRTMELVDSHCHLDLIEAQQPDWTDDVVLAQAAENDVRQCLCVAISLEALPTVLGLASRHRGVHASVGVHPNTHEGEDPDPEQLATLADDPRVVAVGETGLDYFRNQGDLTWQRDRFRRHIAAARQCGKPLIIHSRAAPGDTIRILREEGADETGGVMHCFADDWETAKAALDLGFYISFSGIVTFKNATELHEVARRVPADRTLVETDSPYLAPVPYRGKINQPAYVRHVAEQLAALRGQNLEKIAEQTTENFFRLFAHAA